MNSGGERGFLILHSLPFLSYRVPTKEEGAYLEGAGQVGKGARMKGRKPKKQEKTARQAGKKTGENLSMFLRSMVFAEEERRGVFSVFFLAPAT